MDSSTRTVAPVRRKLALGVDFRCPACKGSGKLRSRFDAKKGRWYAPECSRCRGGGVVGRELADL